MYGLNADMNLVVISYYQFSDDRLQAKQLSDKIASEEKL